MVQMKDSGIDWIGKIPETWNVKKVKYLFFNKKYIPGILSKNYQRLALTLSGIILRDKGDSEGLQPKDFDNYQLINEGNLVFKLIDLQNISTSRVGLAHHTGLVSPAYIVLQKLGSGSVNLQFAEFFFLMLWHRAIFNALGDNGVRSSLNVGDLLNIPMCIPSIQIQNKIADFLDKKCSEIDALTADIQTQIETLEEYKKSVITEAVTKGLDPNVEMKDSGVEWIGKIPRNWEQHPLYCYFDERKNRNFDLKERNLFSLSYGNIIKKDINTTGGLLPASFNTYNIVKKLDIIIRPTDLQNDKRSLRTGLVKDEKGIITSAYIALKPRHGVFSNYFHYLLHSYDVMKVFYNMGNGVRQGLNYSEFSKLMIIAPPSLQEQTRIADFLDQKCSEIDQTISEKQQQLETLAEYKKSLIYEYVTGKKEVS